MPSSTDGQLPQQQQQLQQQQQNAQMLINSGINPAQVGNPAAFNQMMQFKAQGGQISPNALQALQMQQFNQQQRAGMMNKIPPQGMAIQQGNQIPTSSPMIHHQDGQTAGQPGAFQVEGYGPNGHQNGWSIWNSRNLKRGMLTLCKTIKCS